MVEIRVCTSVPWCIVHYWKFEPEMRLLVAWTVKANVGASTLEKSLNKTFNLGVGLSGGESSLLVQV